MLSKREGFTLIELIIVIILIGILAVVVSPKIDIAGFKEDADVMRLYSDIRFVQHKSIVTGKSWYIQFSNKRYTIYDSDGNIANIGSGENPVELKESLNPSINPIYFNYLGNPDNDSDYRTIFSDNVTIQIGDREVLILPISGGVVVR